jgi:hypothetical protein
VRVYRRYWIFASALLVSATVAWVSHGDITGLPVLLLVLGTVTWTLTGLLWQQEKTNYRRDRVQALVSASISEWPLPVISEVSTLALGIAPARSSIPYATREVDRSLDDALANSRFVVVIGGSMAGKSRTAYEAAKRLFPNWRIIVPAVTGSSPFPLLAELNTLQPLGPAVLWLDDLERFLAADGLTPSLVERFISADPPLIILGTMRASSFDHFIPVAEDVGNPLGRSVLSNAKMVYVSSRPTAGELAHVTQLYPEEVFSGDEFRQLLIPIDDLVERYQTGRYGNPTGWAILQAAIDWRKVGAASSISESGLRQLYSEYLTFSPSGELGQNSFEDGLTWALEPLGESAAILKMVRSAPEPKYALLDYFYEHVKQTSEGRQSEIPAKLWELAIRESNPTQCIDVARQAYSHGEYDFARAAFQVAIDSGEPQVAPRAALGLAALLTEQGDLVKAREAFQVAIDSGEPQVAPRAALGLAALLTELGDVVGARAAFVMAIDSGEPQTSSGRGSVGL